MKDGIKILIGVTFREFNGSENEKIQRLFIESIKNQTYSNWRMVVTVFNEEFVKQEIEKYVIDTVFYRNGPVSGYKFSLTDVLLNTITESATEEQAIILWTTCDVIYESTFFEQIVANFSQNVFAICHPHITYRSTVDLNNDVNQIPTSINSGMDVMIMDAEIFRSAGNLKIIQEYRFIDWGVFEHFLVGLALLVHAKRINLFGVCNLFKIENDREVGEETNNWLVNCWENNYIPFNRFVSGYKLPAQLTNLVYCNMQFSIIRNKPAYYSMFARDYFKYFGGRIKRKIIAMIPKSVRKRIKAAQ